MLSIAICDDDQGFIDRLSGLLEKAGKGRPYMTDAYHSGEELLQDLNCAHDLIFLDIQMDGINGVLAGRKIRERDRNVVLVFCSGVYKPTPEAFKATPFRYLVKQHPDERILKDLLEIWEEAELRKNEICLAANYFGTTYRFELCDVMYISLGRRRTSKLHLAARLQKDFSDNLIVNKRLPALYEEIHPYGFGYAHNSYIVNFRYIRLFNRLDLTLSDGKVLTIARGKYNDFLSGFLEFSERCVRESQVSAARQFGKAPDVGEAAGDVGEQEAGRDLSE